LVFVAIFSDNDRRGTVAVSCLPAARQKKISWQNQQQQMTVHNCTINRAEEIHGVAIK
jgi:hypothetical protein